MTIFLCAFAVDLSAALVLFACWLWLVALLLFVARCVGCRVVCAVALLVWMCRCRPWSLFALLVLVGSCVSYFVGTRLIVVVHLVAIWLPQITVVSVSTMDHGIAVDVEVIALLSVSVCCGDTVR